ncbi:tetratricopeptide repeat protein [Archangium lipolyticum]|uniref:tetratricopeptide repeat protein n=1 Tax=Archangium lipolyticum TaxID=2970465 RepID=UPI002149DB43|nr:hypothetical protein [Archangium lipolyticum]
MMRTRAPLLPLIVGVICLGAVAVLAAPPRKPPRGPHQEPMLPRKEVLQVVGRSQLPLLVDYLWIQLLQETGRARTAEEYLDIYPYADLITDLDPQFDTVYRFAGSALPTNLGRETWVNTEESTRLLRKGLPLFPDDVRLLMLLAYNLSTFHKQYREAAQVLEQASKLPGAPEYLSALATRLYAQSGEVEAGMALAQSLVESAEDEETRAAFEQRIRDLEMEAQLQRVDKAIATFRENFGVAPPDIQTLLWLGFLDRPPHDPAGGGFFLGYDERAYSETQRRRLEIFTPGDRGYQWN